jgi:hypothetical protein
MKQICFYIAFIILITSCEKDPNINLGFDSSIDKYSNGLIIAHFSHHDKRIYLRGGISLFEGEVLVELINPDGVIAYSEKIIAPIELQINEAFNVKHGYWKLKYKSNKGVGEINLHFQKL